MSRRLLKPMPDAIVRSQRNASDPARSVWVTANAGSGKTYVLTARVLRLLLSGVPPEEILCLTYTKAAAAEMRGRVAERLAQWALLDGPALDADLMQLEGMAPDAAMRQRARTLFARALDTPGGLKIQTIHAFCESVLHRFPREAGVPFDFGVLEDFERDAMLQQAREKVLAAGVRGQENAAQVETLFGLLSDASITQSIVEALGQQRTLRKVLPRAAEAKRNLRDLVPAQSRDEVIAEIEDGYLLDAAAHRAVFALVAPDPDGDDFVDRLGRIDADRPDADALFEAYLTQSMTARKTLLKKATAALIPDVAQVLTDEAARLEALAVALTRAELIERSEAMLDVVKSIADDYERQKRARSLLDFDDLIEKLAALLDNQSQGPWVLYKLDSRLSHILVDEGQDTNPQQWDVVKALIAEFFVGDSAADRPRTLFVVGDQKQSIFSFQGADPVEFVELGRAVYYTARSVQLDVEQVNLHYSFRTLPDVLGAVDKVFARPDLRAGAMEELGMLHQTARAEGGGQVTLWPPFQEIEDDSDPDNWPIEAPKIQMQSAARRNAERIAREIKGWISSGRPLGPRGRPVTADDVLILVQVRSVLFHEIIRALVRAGIPTPGADRLAVTTHIGTLDLMALGDVLSNAGDDLQLAALLRSPLFDVSERELMDLAQPRGEKETLWAAMQHSSTASVVAAREQLADWRNRLDFERPFNFYSDVLYAGGGLRRFRARFGAEIDDVASQFLELALAHEQDEQPSLQGFLAALRSREVIIKRELAEAGAGVRVMTVHGAKGLEAPIVILADAASTEEGRDRRSIYMSGLPLFFHASSKATHAAETMEHKDEADAAQKAEYWRKLYVAMTRAEDELYVTGALTKTGKLDGTWYEAIETALGPEAETITDAAGETSALIYPRERAATGSGGASSGTPGPVGGSLELPMLPAYRLRRIVRPSTAFADASPDAALQTAAEELAQRRDPETARREGVALHALLHHLSRIAPEQWAAVSAKALPVLLPEHPEAYARLAKKAQSILGRLDLIELFGPNTRPEVPILARGTRNGQPITLAGRIDRLVVQPDRVLVVDYKSDALVPRSIAEVPGGYISQLGLYALCAGQMFPGRHIEAAILWTSLESLMNLPAAKLGETVASFTIG
jgi:ATP-dependent helicase/nuclease subunit A